MGKKCLIALMGVFLVLGFSGSVMAVDDLTGDYSGAAVSAYDIESASVEVYTDGGGIEEYMDICIDMTSSIPGLMIFEFDVDNVATTGGTSSMIGFMSSCEQDENNIRKLQAGFDIAITLLLREQGKKASTAWAANCNGPAPGAQCREQGSDTLCTDCVPTGDCYELGDECVEFSAASCKEIGPECTGAGCPGQTCYDLTDSCPVGDCGMGRLLGEWYASASCMGAGGGAYPDRGRIEMPLPKGTDSVEGNVDCYKLPWKRIVGKVHAATVENGCDEGKYNFDLVKAENSANLKWQLTTWRDPDFETVKAATPGLETDFMDVASLCNEVTDVIPNSGKADALATDGGLCHKYQNMHEVCFDRKANHRNVADQVGTAGCYFNTSITDQNTCEAAGCTWWADKERCVNDMCLGDFNKDTKVKAQERNILMKETARTGCLTCE